DRQLQNLEQRRERLQQELRELQSPDPARLEQLAGDRAAGEEQLEAAQGELAALEARVPEADAERSRAQAASHQEAQSLARLEARLAALVKLQEDVQKQGALEPWLAKHELAGLGRLWQKLHIEPGWENALESVLRERMAAMEVRNLDWSRAFADDAPPARLRRRRPAGAPGVLPVAGGRARPGRAARPDPAGQPAAHHRSRSAHAAQRLAAQRLHRGRPGPGPGPARHPAARRGLRGQGRP